MSDSVEMPFFVWTLFNRISKHRHRGWYSQNFLRSSYDHQLIKVVVTFFGPSRSLQRDRAELTFQVLRSRVGPWSYPKTLDQAGKDCQVQRLQLLRKFVNYDRKTFYRIGPWCLKYKTVFLCHLQYANVFVPVKAFPGPVSQNLIRLSFTVSVIGQSVCPWLVQPSLVFRDKHSRLLRSY